MDKRPINIIAESMIRQWYTNRAKKFAKKEAHEWRDVVYFGAVPYLEAMLTMCGGEGYGYDSTDSVIRYALSNMAGFRGPEAKVLKAELRTHLSDEQDI